MVEQEKMNLPELSPLIDWFHIHRRAFNWRETNEPYKVWVSEVMSQQTRAETVSGYFTRFMALFPTIEALATAPEDLVLKAWEGLGYYSRARNLQKAAQIIMEDYGGHVPSTVKELRSLPGIGPYTAGAIASFSFGIAEPAVDGNAVRITSRLLNLDFTQGDVKDRNKTYDLMTAYFIGHPDEDAASINEAFMTLGATVCIPRAPKCDICPLATVCKARLAGRQALLPHKKPSKKSPVELLTYVFIQRSDGSFLLGQRPPGLLHGMWEALSLDGHFAKEELLLRLDDLNLIAKEILHLGAKKHLFSHLTWELDVWHVVLKDNLELSFNEEMEAYMTNHPKTKFEWFIPQEAKELAFSTALVEFLPWDHD